MTPAQFTHGPAIRTLDELTACIEFDEAAYVRQGDGEPWVWRSCDRLHREWQRDAGPFLTAMAGGNVRQALRRV